MARPWIRDRQLAVYAGIAFSLAGAVLLWDAYGARGRPKPWPLRVLGAVG